MIVQRFLIWCCECGGKVMARLTDGGEIYPHRADLVELPFWKCDACKNYVGCHHKTADRTRPLGNIPTAAIREARKSIHCLLDPLWKTGLASRSELYGALTTVLGRQYHTSELRSLMETRMIQGALVEIGKALQHAGAAQ